MEERLQKFAKLVDIGSYTKAAEQLHISQPALTMAIHKLEQELGQSLFVRSNRKLDLTAAGRAAYLAAQDYQNVTDHLRTRLTSITNKRPVVTIGMTDSVAAVVCATAAFDALELTTDVTIIVNNSRYLREAIKQRQLDLAFIVDDGNEHEGMIVTRIGSEKLVLVCAPEQQQVVETELANGRLSRFISYDKPSTTYKHVQAALRTRGVAARVRLFSTSPDVMLTMVNRGKGSAVLPVPLADSNQLVRPHIGKKPLTIERPIISSQLQGKVLPSQLLTFLSQIKSAVLWD